LSQRVRPEVAGPMTGSAKSEIGREVSPDFALLNPDYGPFAVARPDTIASQNLVSIRFA